MADYKTKFSIGHRVAVISSDWVRKVVGCDVCAKIGKLKIGEEEFVCPKCHGASAHPQMAGSKWFVSHEGIVGKIEIEHCIESPYGSNRFDVTRALIDGPAPEYQVSYMIDSTGIGSGNNWPQERLFPSREDAQAECDKRNLGLDLTPTGEMKKEVY